MKISKKAIPTCFFCLLISLLSIPSHSLHAQQPDLGNVKVTRLLDRTLIGPDIHPSVGINIQGPSMIKVPEWDSIPSAIIIFTSLTTKVFISALPMLIALLARGRFMNLAQ